MEPLNYEIPPPNLLSGIGQGFSLGMGMQQAQLAQQQAQAALTQQQRQQQVIAALVRNPNPTADDYASATLLIPGMREHFKQAWDLHDGEQQKSSLGQIGQVYAALAGGQPEVAATLLDQQADALTNSGGPKDRVQAARTLAQVVRAHPEFARTLTGMHLASIPGGDKVLGNWATMGQEQRAASKAPLDQRKAEAEARIQEVAAGVAPAEADLKLRKGEEDITSAQAKRRIDELNVQIAQANSETQRGQLILERDKLVEKQGEAKKAEASGAQDQLDTLQRSLDTIDRIRRSPALEPYLNIGGGGIGGGVGSITGKLAGLVPGSDARDLRAAIDTLKSQQFLGAVAQMKGLGQLTEAEGKKITDAVGNLDPDQSVGAFKTTLGVIESTVRRAQAKLVAAGKLSTTGGAFVMTHPTYGKVTDGDVNRLLSKYPGATREQVLEYLRQSGGK